MAMPMPPPIHKVANPLRASLLIISCINVTSILVPEAPIGCPKAMAPPLTFTFSSGIESVFKTAILWAANASLTS
tara:strand:+ start:125 stop:349 length:225 start_codon:yes stop_codon:yes gene_type:complete